MDNPELKPQLEAIVPGVVDAYEQLHSRDGMGLHTSTGSFYNHTLFGRDGSMTAKFVADFDHAVAQETIMALTALQGAEFNPRTQEEPGRIHHELRDFRTWKGSLFEHGIFWLIDRAWDVEDKQLLTYFSQDTTASYIRLIHKYATHIDSSILDRSVINHHGEKTTVRLAVERAANWIVDQLDDRDILTEARKNRWSLPFQTFQDSVYARADSSVADYTRGLSYVEVQAYAADALHDAARLLEDHEHGAAWRAYGDRMHAALLKYFWDEKEQFFISCIDSKGVVDVRNVSSGWIFNSSLWTHMPAKEQARYIVPVIERLFSQEFLTNVGLRSRSLEQASPIEAVIAYHDRETVWPMFTFMVIEGLRRHRLYGLAEQLENRVINGLNASGRFDEFFVVSRDGAIHLSSATGKKQPIDIQMVPEARIAFSVVPAMVIAKRASYKNEKLKQLSWQRDLEKKILGSIDIIERAEPSSAVTHVGTITPTTFKRFRAGIKTALYFYKQKKAL